MKVKNEKGVTLIELLAVLVLVTMVGTLIMTTFFIANRFNVTETKKMKMQQEANYIITAVLQKHRTVDECYNLNVSDTGEKIIFSICDEPGTEVIIAENFKYKLSELENRVRPKDGDLSTTLTVSDPENENLSVSVNTIFQRYKTN
ncbi:PilW family protein [Sporosarcina sp. FSL K6-1508]|uniref:PilW family protein n=1 Tax=Sporosarcina sp. FSL K6-1508 TaxID=2921553 RepID=UPI0030FCFB92